MEDAVRKPTPRHMTPRREFTVDEDAFIRANAAGRISMTRLQRMLKCGTDTLLRRASELGVTMYVTPRNVGQPRHERHRKYEPTEENVYTGRVCEAPHVGDDKLLTRLQDQHGDRRYEELKLSEKRR